jgi:hypothetical protein
MYKTWQELLVGSGCGVTANVDNYPTHSFVFCMNRPYRINFNWRNGHSEAEDIPKDEKMYGLHTKSDVISKFIEGTKLVCYTENDFGCAFVIKNKIKFFKFVAMKPNVIRYGFNMWLMDELKQDVLNKTKLVMVDEDLYNMWLTRQALDKL